MILRDLYCNKRRVDVQMIGTSRDQNRESVDNVTWRDTNSAARMCRVARPLKNAKPASTWPGIDPTLKQIRP